MYPREQLVVSIKTKNVIITTIVFLIFVIIIVSVNGSRSYVEGKYVCTEISAGGINPIIDVDKDDESFVLVMNSWTSIHYHGSVETKNGVLICRDIINGKVFCFRIKEGSLIFLPNKSSDFVVSIPDITLKEKVTFYLIKD